MNAHWCKNRDLFIIILTFWIRKISSTKAIRLSIWMFPSEYWAFPQFISHFTTDVLHHVCIRCAAFSSRTNVWTSRSMHNFTPQNVCGIKIKSFMCLSFQFFWAIVHSRYKTNFTRRKRPRLLSVVLLLFSGVEQVTKRGSLFEIMIKFHPVLF